MPTTPNRRPFVAATPTDLTQPSALETAESNGPKSDTKILPPDTRVGRYVVRKPLGRGGMGCVYLAWDDDLRRTVAVKVMHPALASESENRQRFLREARAVAALSHDNVISIFEVGQSNGLVFYAMPHLTGTSLAQYLHDKGTPSVAAAVRIAREIASGLASAHAEGLLHRDVKPGNVFLESPKGRVKLLDFGLATSTTGDGKLTETGMVVGTPAYMSPEQARGLPLDARADLFSLGAVLYHLTTGRMPFQGPDTLAILTALAVDTPPPVRDANPRVPLRLESLIDRLLSKKAEERPNTADEVIAELKAVERELAGGGTNGIAMPAPRELADAADAIVVREPVDTDTPPPTRRRRKGKRTRKGKAQRQVQMILIGGGVALALGAVLALTLLLTNMNAPPAKGTQPAASPPPPTYAEPPGRPWSAPGEDGQPRYWANDHTGQARQLPEWWKPGMRLPPEFLPPPPPPPRP